MSVTPVAFPPPTSNTLSSRQRSVLVRSARKLSKILGDVPRVLDTPPANATESAWRKRKPTHLPPLIKPPTPSLDAPDSPSLSVSPSTRRGSVLSVAPSILSNAPSSASGSSGALSEATQRRLKIEHVRRKLGHEVPATAIFPTTAAAAPHSPQSPRTPHTPKTARPSPRGRTRSRSRSRTRSVARHPRETLADDGRSVTFSISSDESMHTVTFSTTRVHSPRSRSHKPKHVYLTGPLPPVPSIPAHLAPSSSSSSSRRADDDAGLIRPRQKVAAGSRIGGSEFKAAQRAKREGRLAEPGELIEMVGFLH